MRRTVATLVPLLLLTVVLAPASGAATGPLVPTTYAIASSANPFSLTGARGPFADANGNLYVFLRDDVSSNQLEAWRSSDSGVTWSEVGSIGKPDGPGSGSVRAYDCHQRGAVIHIAAYVDTGSGGTVYYSTFRTSDHPVPDTWGVVDEPVDTYVDTSSEYGVGIFAASDGDVAVVMSGEGGSSPVPPGGSGRESTMYAVRTNGSWTPHLDLVTPAADTPASGIARGLGDRFYGVGKAEFSSPGEKWQYRAFADVGASPSAVQALNVDTDPVPSTFNYHEAHPVGVSYEAPGGQMRTLFGYMSGGDVGPHLGYTATVEDGGAAGPDIQMSSTPIKVNEGGYLTGHVGSWTWDVDPATRTIYSVFVSAVDNELYLRRNVDGAGWGLSDEHFAGSDAQLPSAGVYTRDGRVYLGVIWDDSNGTSTFGTTRFASYPLRDLGGDPVNTAPSVDAGPDQQVVYPAAALLQGQVADDGLPGGSPSTTWSLRSGPEGASVSFDDPGALATAASFSAPGTFVLELTASDGELTSSDTMTVVSMNTTVVQTRVSAKSDDAEERASGDVRQNDDLDLVTDGAPQTVGIRFASVAVPRGAQIVSAWIQFKADERGANATSLTIEGQSADDALTFTKSTRNVSSRPRTQARVPWVPPSWANVGEAGPAQRSPDLTSIVQEIVARPGWSSGHALVFIITGTGKRAAESFEGDAAGAPLLRVEFRA